MGGTIGYRLESGKGNIDALADGFERPALPGGRIALFLSGVDSLAEEREWVLGLISIASDHSTYHLALGSRYLSILLSSNDSPFVDAIFDRRTVPHPWPLRLS